VHRTCNAKHSQNPAIVHPKTLDMNTRNRMLLKALKGASWRTWVSLLYKYFGTASNQDGKDDLPPILKNLTLLASDPCNFNDPFEVRPFFSHEHHDFFAASHEAHMKDRFGISYSLLGNRTMVGFPTENSIGFAERLNGRFRDEIRRQFRVICLSRNKSAPLMWGHYGESYRGLAIGIEADHEHFPKGINNDGFPVIYSKDRSQVRLPLAYYSEPTVETYNLHGCIVNDPNEYVQHDGGLVIPFSEYRKLVEETKIHALTTKAEAWKYEEEVRFIYDISQSRRGLIFSENKCFAPIPKDSIREIIVGNRCPQVLIERLVKHHKEGAFGDAKLFYTICHPNRYEVQTIETTVTGLLTHWQHRES
jgi:hypothetical protein